MSARGPYAATHTSSSEPCDQANRTGLPLTSASREFPRSWITVTDSRRVARLAGRPCSVRTAESPRPMPQIVRLPYVSLSVANMEASTVESRVAGLVTIGPTTTRSVAARIAG